MVKEIVPNNPDVNLYRGCRVSSQGRERWSYERLQGQSLDRGEKRFVASQGAKLGSVVSLVYDCGKPGLLLRQAWFTYKEQVLGDWSKVSSNRGDRGEI